MSKAPSSADEWLEAIHREFPAESDRGAALVAAGMLDEALRSLLTKRLVSPPKEDRSLFRRASGPLSSFSAKIDAAFQLGLISCYLARDLHLIREIRNEFAHHAFECTFPGMARNWGMCYEKAGELCGTREYDVVNQSGEHGAAASITPAGGFGGSVISRSMLVKCKP